MFEGTYKSQLRLNNKAICYLISINQSKYVLFGHMDNAKNHEKFCWQKCLSLNRYQMRYRGHSVLTGTFMISVRGKTSNTNTSGKEGFGTMGGSCFWEAEVWVCQEVVQVNRWQWTDFVTALSMFLLSNPGNRSSVCATIFVTLQREL